MTDLRDKMRRLLAGETITIGEDLPPLSTEAVAQLRQTLDAHGDQSESAWRDAGPDTETATVAIHHVRAADIVAARARYGEDDDPGAERWSEATAWLCSIAVARDASNRWSHVLIAHIVFELIGRSRDNIYDPDELRAAIATIAGRPELPSQVAAELAARRARTEVPPWPTDAANAPYAWLIASLQRASNAGLGIFWEVVSTKK